MRKFCDFVEKSYQVFFYLSGAFLFLMFATCAYSVFCRFIGSPSIWADELIRFLMVFMTFAGAPYMINAKSNLMVDLTDIFFSKRKKLLHKTHLIGDLMLLAIIVYLIFPTFDMAMKNMTSRTTALNWTLGYIYLCMPASFFISAIAQVKNIIKDFVLPKKTADVSVKGAE